MWHELQNAWIFGEPQQGPYGYRLQDVGQALTEAWSWLGG
jgi:hypothetical protein